jgi:hypothetical protein
MPRTELMNSLSRKAASEASADLSKLFDSVKGLVDVLSKASPTLLLLAASLVFMALSAYASSLPKPT